jgi:GNAT superfamily N-acetyltransferase
MQLRQVSLTDPAAAPLLADLEVEYHARYGANDELRQSEPGEFVPPVGAFVVLLDGEVTAAGGGYRAHAPGVCEVKRMWTHPDYRRQGLAARVLGALEDLAAAAGYDHLVLETGPRQPEAAALYERRGYARIPVYGRYPEAIAFGTELSRPRREPRLEGDDC